VELGLRGRDGAQEHQDITKPGNAATFAIAEAAQQAINKRKSESGAGVGRGVTRMKLAANPATLAGFERVRAGRVACRGEHGAEVAMGLGVGRQKFRDKYGAGPQPWGLR
jgi:hypothetical protein